MAMSTEEDKTETYPNKDKEKPLCSCVTDPFTSLPPGLRPRNRSFMDDLRKVICPGCGLVYWTNRKTDFCAECEKNTARNAAG